MAEAPIHEGYARAMLEMARAEGVVARAEEEFFRLRELLKQTPDLLKFLKDPNIKREGRRHALSELFAGKVHPLVLNGLLAMSDSDRAGEATQMIDAFIKLASEARQHVSGEVTTAIPLDDALKTRLREALARTTGKNVELFQKVDPSILGGAIIKLGDQVIDGSLRTKLNRIREQLTP